LTIEGKHTMQTTHPDLEATHPGRSLRRDLQQAPGFSTWALLLAILGSAVGTIITSAFGSAQWGALAGAAIGPVISTTFSTKRTGETGRVRSATIILLSAGALLITVTGFTFADQVVGKSVLPGAHQRLGTFFPLPKPPVTPPPSGDTPGIQVQPTGTLDCGTATVGVDTPCAQPVTITSTGTGVLRIISIDVIEPDGQDFIASQDCVGESLNPHQSCDVQIGFQPTAAGPRQATLVIHQNIPWPDQGARITLTGTGDDGNGTSPTQSPSQSPSVTESPSQSPSATQSPSQPGTT
jgi:hypothetical protein